MSAEEGDEGGGEAGRDEVTGTSTSTVGRSVGPSAFVDATGVGVGGMLGEWAAAGKAKAAHGGSTATRREFWVKS